MQAEALTQHGAALAEAFSHGLKPGETGPMVRCYIELCQMFWGRCCGWPWAWLCLPTEKLA